MAGGESFFSLARRVQTLDAKKLFKLQYHVQKNGDIHLTVPKPKTLHFLSRPPLDLPNKGSGR